MDEYLKSLNTKQLKELINQYEKPKNKKLTGLKREELKGVLKELMVGGSKMKCIAKCPKGRCDCWYTKAEKLHGSGFLDLFKRPKKDYSNGSKSTLKKYGDKTITSLEVVRTPI